MQANRRHMATQANIENKQKGMQKEGRKKKANLFENRFRSGGEKNERRMANNVMQEMRVYDEYLVCLDLA